MSGLSTDAHNAGIYRDTVEQMETAAANGDDRLLRAVADFADLFGPDATTTAQDWDLVRGGTP